MRRELLGLVLRGGESRRMGEDKARLEARPGVPQLDYALSLLDRLCLSLAVGVGEQSRGDLLPRGVAEIRDDPSLGGPMAGVVAGLAAAEDWGVQVIACDMPYLDIGLLVQLANRRDTGRLGTCFRGADGRPEPLCAIYEPACRDYLLRRAAAGDLSLRRALEAGDFEIVDPADPEYLASVNEPSELDAARLRLRRGNPR